MRIWDPALTFALAIWTFAVLLSLSACGSPTPERPPEIRPVRVITIEPPARSNTPARSARATR